MDSFQGASFSSKIFFLLPEDFCCKRRLLRYRSPIRLPALSSLPAKFPLEIWTPFKEHRFFGNSFFLSGKFPHHLRLLRYRSPIRLLALSLLPAKFPLEIWTPFKEHRFFGNSFFLSGKFPHHLRLLRYRSPIRLLALSLLPAKFPLEIWTQLHYTKSGLNVQGYYKSSSLSEAGGFMKS
ncbi:hypothetical protein [Eubacterium callanderi]|uniref:hypothetical protein n=1 Tax=Eubacterium callanderi TaxID=53442 RepID=UPI001C1001D9|nr:hypothetical protein [Eubacterium callanderi]MBU5302015.1 hypothetical protein [Eubacterium callanderi]